jgi:hypothetical protein
VRPVLGKESLPLALGEATRAAACADRLGGGVWHEDESSVGLTILDHIVSGDVAAERYMGLSAHDLHDGTPGYGWLGTVFSGGRS